MKSTLKSKIKNTLYWIGVLLINLAAYGMLAFLLGISLGFDNSYFSGLLSWAIVICGMVYTADDEQREAFRKIIGK